MLVTRNSMQGTRLALLDIRRFCTTRMFFHESYWSIIPAKVWSFGNVMEDYLEHVLALTNSIQVLLQVEH